ncbi:MAG: dipeptidase PepE [Flavobacteriaceae bacterium]|nr:dipeptidase PepE [Flavobacteriaceae bacterium]
MKQLIVASTSTIYGSGYLEYLLPQLSDLFSETEEIIFIPYARPGGISHDDYTAVAAKAFAKIDIGIRGLHEYEDPIMALENAKGVFTGGGNTFVLVSQLYKNGILEPLRNAIHAGTPYLGTSAGSNICGLTMQTTNDMPIVYPPSFKTLGILPFNINPHYLDPIEGSKHMGESRETRIKEFHTQNHLPVVGLREGSWLQVKGDSILLKGSLSARIFEYGKEPYEIDTETSLDLIT